MNGCRDKGCARSIFILHIMLALVKHGGLVFKDGLPENAVADLIKGFDQLQGVIPAVHDLRPLLTVEQLALLEEGIAYGYF